MKKIMLQVILCCFAMALAPLCNADVLPVRGIHFGVPGKSDLPLCLKFIREALPKEGVNTLVLEFDYRYQYKSHPELVPNGALSRDDVKQIVSACRDAKIELIPQINCFGHQSWAKHTSNLLSTYPEFDETPGKYPDNKDIYCRSYCPYHPKVHPIMFALIDELSEVCESKAVHVGLDEVFIIADEDCPRCKDKTAAEVFAYEVNALHGHLKKSGKTLWMWGDRFLDGKITGLGKWEASANNTTSSIDLVPKDIVICDWHYERAEPTAAYFAIKGFQVVSSPWRKSEVALGQLQLINLLRKDANSEIAIRMRGMLHTTWCGMVPFIKEYYDQGDQKNEAAMESVDCFKKLFAAIPK